MYVLSRSSRPFTLALVYKYIFMVPYVLCAREQDPVSARASRFYNREKKMMKKKRERIKGIRVERAREKMRRKSARKTYRAHTHVHVHIQNLHRENSTCTYTYTRTIYIRTYTWTHYTHTCHVRWLYLYTYINIREHTVMCTYLRALFL